MKKRDRRAEAETTNQQDEIPVRMGRRSLFGRFCRFVGRRTRELRDGQFFGRRNTAVVPRILVMGDYTREHYGLQGGRRKKKTRRKRRTVGGGKQKKK